MARVLLCLSLAGCTAPRLTPEPPATADPSNWEGAARGFPSLRSLDGRRLADGSFSQWLEGGSLRVRTEYVFPDGRRIEETASFRQEPRLTQERWLWREIRGGVVVRQYRVDFETGGAVAEKWEGGEAKQWTAAIELEPGRTFAGIGFSLAVKHLRERLRRGERIELLGVGFLPKPQIGKVEVSYRGLDRLTLGGVAMLGERYVIHPKPPILAKLFVDLPDTRLWFTHPPPAGFLRSEAPLAEPTEPVYRIDLLPGAESGPADPVEQ
jgi:hypothetical protein